MTPAPSTPVPSPASRPSPADLFLRAAADYFAGRTALNDLLQLIMDRVIELTHATRGLFILGEHDGELDFRVARNMRREELENPRNAISRKAILEVYNTGESFRTRNALDDPRLADSQSVHNLSLKSILCAPLTAQGKVIGLIYLENNLAAGVFCDDHAAMLDEIAELASHVLGMTRRMESVRGERDLLEQENLRLLERFDRDYEFGRFVGRSPAMQKVQRHLAALASSPHPVLIQGESGTGKEMVARILHATSERRDRPFVAINCAALPAALFESELFGYVSGAFTGADRTRIGKVEAAEGGTLFLDEVGELPAEVQAKLLRVLQEGTFDRLGENRTRKADVRVLAATNKDLAEQVEKRLFREDLFFRLEVLRVQLPALRERPEDIAELAGYFLSKEGRHIAGFTPGAIEFMKGYSWPGNIRSLRNVVVRACVYTTDGEPITEAAIREQINEREERLIGRDRGLELSIPLDATYDEAMAAVEREYLHQMLKRWPKLSRTELADKLGMRRRTFFDHLRKLGLTGGDE